MSRPRWSRRPLPPYRHLPGSTPHPRRDPGGHARGRDEERVPEWSPEAWRSLETWRWGVDLFNHGYWWEAHEAFEALWHAAGRAGERADFVQALIHLSAACLNRRRGHAAAARRQAGRAIEGLGAAPSSGYMGIDIPALVEAVRTWEEDPGTEPLQITLRTPPRVPGAPGPHD